MLCRRQIKDTAKGLVEKVYALEEGGSTALGPAVVAAVGIASNAAGSRVRLRHARHHLWLVASGIDTDSNGGVLAARLWCVPTASRTWGWVRWTR